MELKPKFRPDIREHTHAEKGGGRTVVLEDPVGNKFFRISPYEYELLKTLDGQVGLKEAIARLKLRGRYFTETHAARLVEQFSRSGLLLGTPYGTAKIQSIFKDRMERELKSRSFAKLYYLYVPLFNPDRFLDRTLPYARLLVNRFTLGLFALLVFPAAYLLVSGASRITGQFLFFFNVHNLFALWAAIAVSKLLHEFAHAYTAKSFGLRVPEMGLAFLIFFPCLYCNTTAAWALADRRERALIALAGILSEVALAVISVFVWFFSQPGLVNSIAFYLMAISVVSSLFFNGNPLMKFDGYFVLIDMLRMPNLQGKAFGLLRATLWNRVLGVESVPVPKLEGSERLILWTYGVSAFIYRIFLVTGIVAGIYYRFDKTLGLLMGAGALFMFILRPLTRAAANLGKRRAEMTWRPRGVAVFLLILVITTVALSIPWAGNSTYPCYVVAKKTRHITVPADAPVKVVRVRQGDIVREGDALFALDPVPLRRTLQEKKAQLALVKQEIAIIEGTEKELSRLRTKLIELSQAQDAVEEAQRDLDNLEWTAPFSGAVTRLSPELQPGARPGKGAAVGELSSLGPMESAALVPETDIGLFRIGAPVRLWLPIGQGKTFTAPLKEINPFKAEDLAGSPFSGRFGGEIAVEEKAGQGKDTPLEPQYVCKTDLPVDPAVRLGMTGRLVAAHPPRSALQRFKDAAYQTFHGETLF
jgi:putative peptide zinc metalloprotease protein